MSKRGFLFYEDGFHCGVESVNASTNEIHLLVIIVFQICIAVQSDRTPITGAKTKTNKR